MSEYAKLIKGDRSINFLTQTSLFFIFLPYVSIIPTDSDTQPLAFLFSFITLAIIFLCCQYRKIEIPITWINAVSIFCLMYVTLISLVQGTFELRGIIGYASILVFSLIALFLQGNRELLRTPLVASIFIWLFVGLIQTLMNREFATSFISRASTSASRGVVALATEPSHYASMCIFFIIILELVKQWNIFYQRERLLQLICAFQVVFLARSAHGVLALILLYFLKIFLGSQSKIKFLFYTSVILSFYTIALNFIDIKHSTRVTSLLDKIIKNIDNPLYIFISDASANQRAADIFISIYSFYEDMPLVIGHGLGTWSQYLESAQSIFSQFWYIKIASNRIMSGYGSLLYESGLVGLMLIVAIFYAFNRSHNTRNSYLAFFILIFMFSAIPLATPIFGLIIGIASTNQIYTFEATNLDG